jgi:uncharacterized BrkB/YihY/UPF0761 family membrane protein
MARERPLGITILAILALIGAVGALIVTLQMLHLLPIYVGQLHFWTFDFWGALLWGILFLIYLWFSACSGMLTRRDGCSWSSFRA